MALKHLVLSIVLVAVNTEQCCVMQNNQCSIDPTIIMTAMFGENSSMANLMKKGMSCSALNSSNCHTEQNCEIQAGTNICQMNPGYALGALFGAHSGMGQMGNSMQKCKALTTDSTCTADADCAWSMNHCDISQEKAMGALVGLLGGDAGLGDLLEKGEACVKLTNSSTCGANANCQWKSKACSLSDEVVRKSVANMDSPGPLNDILKKAMTCNMLINSTACSSQEQDCEWKSAKGKCEASAQAIGTAMMSSMGSMGGQGMQGMMNAEGPMAEMMQKSMECAMIQDKSECPKTPDCEYQMDSCTISPAAAMKMMAEDESGIMQKSMTCAMRSSDTCKDSCEDGGMHGGSGKNGYVDIASHIFVTGMPSVAAILLSVFMV